MSTLKQSESVKEIRFPYQQRWKLLYTVFNTFSYTRGNNYISSYQETFWNLFAFSFYIHLTE